jgi:2-polyprenyl-3-methyl-5-hydroxy-6-metoxy-1,4-benzoquinol methylase
MNFDEKKVELAEVACPLCGSHNSEKVLSAKDYLCGVPGLFAIQKCKNCDMCYLSPAPRPGDLHKIYPEIYHKSFINQKPSWIKERVDFIRTVSPGGRLLEVGCSAGHFLNEARDAGYDVSGIELDTAAGEFARKHYGLKVEIGSIKDIKLPHSFFQLIVLFDVFEHLTEPVACLEKLISALAPGGHIVIRVPNFSSYEARMFKENWYPLDLPRHLLHFSPATLSRMLSDAGFSLFKISHEVEPEILVLSVIRYIYNMLDKKTGTSLANETGDSDHVTRHLRLKKFITKSLAIPFFVPAKILSLIKSSNTITAVARKI